MRLYKLMTHLSQMVQWFKRKKSPCDRKLLNLNIGVHSAAQEKNLERLVRFRSEAAFNIMEDILSSAYQLELIGVHRVKTDDPCSLARHLGRVDALYALMRMMSDVKSVEVKKAADRADKEEKKRARGYSRPVI